MSRTNVYRYFCPIARSLELVGEKWTLPIVLALLLEGPLRFSDLQRQLVSITPRSLSARLRELEAAGLVEHDRRDGGDGRYALTAAGHDLGPVLSALNRWSVEHAVRPPEPDEALSPEPVARSIWAYLLSLRTSLQGPRCWELRIGDNRTLALSYDGRRWSQSSATPADPPSLLVEGSLPAWAAFLAAGSGERGDLSLALAFTGPHEERERFLALFGTPAPRRASLGAAVPA